MKNKKFASFLAAAAALVLLAMPAFAADEQTELPAAEAAEVQQEQTAAPMPRQPANRSSSSPMWRWATASPPVSALPI